jgi:hypothetical protein
LRTPPNGLAPIAHHLRRRDAVRLLKNRVFMEDLVDCRASTHGVVFIEDVVEIVSQQAYGINCCLIASATA